MSPPDAPATSTRDDAVAVVRRLREAGHVAYFAGGCVRDGLLGLAPADFDVATDAPPDRVRGLFRAAQAVGAAFGVVLVRSGRSQVEVATFRTDGAYADGRRPASVRFTTADEDARRRDFTINGMFLDPLTGDVIDFVGGRDDLAAGRLRAIGDADARFAEDHLRLLRAVRFAARFGLTIEDATASAVARHAGHLRRISPERVAGEVRLMLTAPTRRAAWALLNRFGLAGEVFRFLSPGEGRPAGDLFEAVATDTASFPLALAAAGLQALRTRLADDPAALLSPATARDVARAIRQGLKVSNETESAVTGIVEQAGLLLAGPEPAVAQLKRFLARPVADDARVLLDALATIGVARDRVLALRPRLAELATADVAPPPLVTGDDLTAAGLTPGPAFKFILERVYDAQLEGRVTTKAQAMAMATADSPGQ